MVAHAFYRPPTIKEIGGIVTTKENSRLVLEDTTLMAGETRAEIDLTDGVILKTWKLLGFSQSRRYEIDDNIAVQIKDNSTMIEGYNIASFGVYLRGRGGTIRISSTVDLQEARLIRDEITEFLKESAAKSSDMRSPS
jgi:hypothetical protein